MRLRPGARRRETPEVLAALLRLSRDLGRPPTYRELGWCLYGCAPSSVHDELVRLRAAGVLSSEPRISFQPRAHVMLARVILELRDPDDAASELLRQCNQQPEEHHAA